MVYEGLTQTHATLKNTFNKLQQDMNLIKASIDNLERVILINNLYIDDKIIDGKWEYRFPYIYSYNGSTVLFCPHNNLAQTIINDHNLNVLIK